MVKQELVLRKIALIQADLEKLAALAKFTFNEIQSDYLKQNTLERLLEKIIMRAVDINEHLLLSTLQADVNPPKTYKETFLALSGINVCPVEFSQAIAKSTGLRNLLAHDYDEGIDHNKLYASLIDCLKDYHRYCDYILEFLDK